MAKKQKTKLTRFSSKPKQKVGKKEIKVKTKKNVG